MFKNAKTRVRDRSMTRVLKSSKLRQPGATGVGHGRYARSDREAVGIDAAVAGIRPALAGAGVDVHVDVHESRGYVQARRRPRS